MGIIKESQSSLPGVDSYFLDKNILESMNLLSRIACKGGKPLIVQFSGGNDSMAMLGLVREVTENFVCSFMATGLEFKGVVQFVKETCAKMGVRLLVSHPGLHKGNMFKRIEVFKRFPHLQNHFCCRDLKLRPNKKLLEATFGKGVFYKLVGVRRSESSRRRYIYMDYIETLMRADAEQHGSFEVFPILNWSDDDIKAFIQDMRLPVSEFYEEFGVSGCSWCPFYSAKIYRRVLEKMPNHYDRVIEMEEKLGQPSVLGNIYLRDIKRAVLEGTNLPPKGGDLGETKRPCMMMFEGKEVSTCEVYGHFYLNGRCYRCDVSGNP